MNVRLIIFSGIVMACLGSVFGLAVSKMSQKTYQCCDLVSPETNIGYSQPREPLAYGITGATMGFAVGSILEMLREAKPEEEQN
ncbi:MAG: hypothetical protein ACP5D7_05400 [Limnospira sp.]